MTTKEKGKQMNHTLGPWSYGVDASGKHFYIHTGKEQRLDWHIETYGQNPITEADATLIASAPDMIKLLNDITEWDGILPHSMKRIKDVIAKAEGR